MVPMRISKESRILHPKACSACRTFGSAYEPAPGGGRVTVPFSGFEGHAQAVLGQRTNAPRSRETLSSTKVGAGWMSFDNTNNSDRRICDGLGVTGPRVIASYIRVVVRNDVTGSIARWFGHGVAGCQYRGRDAKIRMMRVTSV